ncbi:hypothetical protein Acsp05_48730 [Actinokineospora sp. NBRC 105648]|nr:hypothetical protein Acsp05_48730 [Actinokineospora sp. NBRC 105648]
MATPPPGVSAPAPRRVQVRYLGPPAYRTPPRWGFPVLAWRWQSTAADAESPEVTAAAGVERVRVRARAAVSALWLLAVLALVAAGAEAWRYALLVQSRTGALPRGTVRFSDTLVLTGSILSLVLGVLAAGATLWWLYAARRAAAERAGFAPARPDWEVGPSLLIPGYNLVVPGAIMAELEHAVLRRPAEERPRPTPLLRAWWIAWAASGLLFAVTVVWRLRDSVQAQADGVLLTAATDLAAVVVAVLTARVVTRLSSLISPVNPASVRLMRVVRVDGAPAVERAVRPATATR